MKHLGDICKIDGSKIEPVDVVIGGSPCFPGDTLILADRGYTLIKNIKVGDVVLTHTGNWKRVTACGNKISETVILKGNNYGLETTLNHPIYSSELKRKYPTYENGKRGNERHLINVGNWTDAKDMFGKMWAIPNKVQELEIPIGVSSSTSCLDMPQISNDFMYFVGRWIGDGWLRTGQRCGRPLGQTHGRIMLCCNRDEVLEVRDIMSKLFSNWSESEERTVIKFSTYGKVLCSWLFQNFGQYADQKRIPSWVYGMSKDLRISLLNGILDSDGYERDKNHYSITTVSKYLAHGIRLLGETLGYSTSIYFDKRPQQTEIEGRAVNQKDTYQVVLRRTNRSNAMYTDIHTWYKVKCVETTGEVKTVYNLTVEDDNSYIAEGVVVHNCQDLSIAGKRAGLDGERSGLFMEQIRIVREMRKATDEKYPRYMVWENVPGVFSSNKGEDFRAVLEETAKIADESTIIPRPPKDKWSTVGCIMGDGWSIAWRVSDAQFWGVPQRRRRIMLIADFGGQSAPEILFEHKSMSGDFEESGETRERTSRDTERGIRTAGFAGMMGANARSIGYAEEQTGTLTSKRIDHVLIEDNIGLNNRGSTYGDTVETLRADSHGAIPTVCEKQSKCYGIGAYNSNAMLSSNPHSGIYEAETSRTLDLNGGNPSCNQGGIAIVEKSVLPFDTTQCTSPQNGNNPNWGDPCHPITSTGHTPKVVEKVESQVYDARGNGNGEIVNTLTGDHQNRITDYTAICIGNGQTNQFLNSEKTGSLNCMHDQQAIMTKSVVRRLTPLECERLQGFPDFWTDVECGYSKYIGKNPKRKDIPMPVRKKRASDTARYKALGNSIAIPPWRWVLQRLCMQFDRLATLGSLFDGIGGFPLIWSEINGKENCLWASEIEEFPILVTEYHFNKEEE